MPTEIERKFLVVSDGWRATATAGVLYRQAYLARTRRGSTRVRVSPHGAVLTVKSRRRGLVRDEFSYPIPTAEAEYLLAHLCATPVVEKVRHLVRHAGMIWEVDVYRGVAAGLVVAEIELDRPDRCFEIPAWAGAEVTYDLRYRNSRIAVAGPPIELTRLAAEALVHDPT